MSEQTRVQTWLAILSVGALSMGFTNFTAHAEALPTILPAPQHMEWASGEPGWTQVQTVLYVDIPESCQKAATGLEALNKKREMFSLQPLKAEKNSDAGTVFLSLASNGTPAKNAPLSDLPVPKAEGYRLVVSDGDIQILGEDLPGLYYGLVTLTQLLDDEGRIPQVAISDWPDQPFRGTYIAGTGGIEARIAEIASLKMNYLLIEDGGFYTLNDEATRKQWQDIFALCREHFIEPIPELQSLGWGQYVLAVEPRAAEGVSVEDLALQATDGELIAPDVPIAPPLEVANPSFEEGEGRLAAGWEQEAPGENTAAVKGVTQRGKRCMRISREEFGTMRVWQNVSCRPDTFYELSCLLKTDLGEASVAYIEVYGMHDADTLGDFLIAATAVTGERDWHRSAVRFESEENTLLRIYIRIQEGKGTAWFDEVQVTGAARPHPLNNVLLTDLCDVLIQSEDGKTTYEADRDYVLHPPDIRFHYRAEDVLEISLPEGTRIADGDTVLASYTHAPPGSITCCPSEPLYRETMRRAIRETIGYLQPKYLHIGHDEPRVINRDKRCTDRGMTSGELFVDEVKRMREYVREADPNVQMMMWDDAVNPYQNAPSLGIENVAADIPKDVIVCVWWYAERDAENQIEKSTQYFLDHDFAVTGSCWFDPRNAYRWAETITRHGQKNPKALGTLYTSWAHPTEDPWGALTTFAEHAWTTGKPDFED